MKGHGKPKRVGPFNGVEFELSPKEGGVFMCRRTLDARGGKVQQCIIFQSKDDFHLWCDADTAVKMEPLLHAELNRCIDEYFAA